METQDIVRSFKRRLLAAKGISQMSGAAVARALGKSQTTIYRWLDSPGDARLCDLLDVIRVLGADPEKVLKETFAECREDAFAEALANPQPVGQEPNIDPTVNELAMAGINDKEDTYCL